jgi:hypothetical protein
VPASRDDEAHASTSLRRRAAPPNRSRGVW